MKGRERVQALFLIDLVVDIGWNLTQIQQDHAKDMNKHHRRQKSSHTCA